LGLDPGKIHTVYLGVEGDMFRPARQAERQAKRAQLGWGLNTPVIAFVGAPGDRRKGFDTVFDAWRTLYQNGSWDGHLAVIGAGPQLGRRKAAAEQAAMKNVHFLGFRPDVPQILPACDALVSPSRYEPYGMGVAEAICCGLPAFVSADAGVAERYPAQLRELLLQDANDASELAGKLRKWRGDMQRWPQAVASLAQALRKCSWEQMASQIVQFIEETA
jgi:glycosyltransferase involved in cell wall biosynthesis